MNLELLEYFFTRIEAFHQNYPEAADGHLERIKKDESGGCATFVVTIHFNRPGSLVAVGCNDGRIEIWDFVTRRIAKIIVAHSHPVCSISWSRNSRQLLSASTDNTVAIWNIVTGECERIFTFPCPVMKVQFNPRNSAEILVCPLRHPPVLIDVTTGKPIILKQEDEVRFCHWCIILRCSVLCCTILLVSYQVDSIVVARKVTFRFTSIATFVLSL
ncbi:unnamed protein product [Hydatigera taeniaeformis]|uniref:WD_REPEATS_REGION domain-containing protein n=1 Tax=Hydatigena taeniaeformis TaxID=6205 RepID=A0A0R3XBP4_HYDTA|nr:unnamed protein product [Hydatigera taeniaeformis]